MIYKQMPARRLSDRENEGTEPHQQLYENLKPRDVNGIVPGLENSCSTSADITQLRRQYVASVLHCRAV